MEEKDAPFDTNLTVSMYCRTATLRKGVLGHISNIHV